MTVTVLTILPLQLVCFTIPVACRSLLTVDESFLGEMDAPSFVDYGLGERDWLGMYTTPFYTYSC